MTEQQRRLLAIPATHQERMEHCRRQQQFYGNRFPEYHEFVEFLTCNRNFVFTEDSYYECSMSYCGGGPVSEGYSTDIDINAPAWFRTFERSTRSKEHWTGRELLHLLSETAA